MASPSVTAVAAESSARMMGAKAFPRVAVLDQIDMLGAEVVPVLRKEFAVGRSPDVPRRPHP